VKAPLSLRFALHVDTKGPTPIQRPDLGPCHTWNGCTMKPGRGRLPYGAIKVDGRKRLAHCVAYELYVGPIPQGKILLHACDNPRCVNVAHLRPGSHSENLKEAHDRGRRKKAA
jgi:hypothetical protein